MKKIADYQLSDLSAMMFAAEYNPYEHDAFAAMLNAKETFYSGDVVSGLWKVSLIVAGTVFKSIDDGIDTARAIEMLKSVCRGVRDGDDFPNEERLEMYLFDIMSVWEAFSDDKVQSSVEGQSFHSVYKAVCMAHWGFLDDVFEESKYIADAFAGMIKSGILTDEQNESFRNCCSALHFLVSRDILSRSGEFAGGSANRSGVNPFTRTSMMAQSAIDNLNTPTLEIAFAFVAVAMELFIALNDGLVDASYTDSDEVKRAYGIWAFYLHPRNLAKHIDASRNRRIAHLMFDKGMVKFADKDNPESFYNKAHFYF